MGVEPIRAESQPAVRTYSRLPYRGGGNCTPIARFRALPLAVGSLPRKDIQPHEHCAVSSGSLDMLFVRPVIKGLRGALSCILSHVQPLMQGNLLHRYPLSSYIPLYQN